MPSAHPINKSACDPTLATVTAFGVVDVDAALLNFLLKPTSGDFAGILFEKGTFSQADCGLSICSPEQIIFVTAWVHRSACCWR